MSVIAVVGLATMGMNLAGLATMGMNLARNLAHKNFGVSVYNRTTSRVDDFMKQYGTEGAFTPAHTPQELVSQLEKPRRILMMVKAGAPVDETIDHLAPHLDAGDILIDGGNSYFLDTVRRGTALEARGLRFIGTGVSGGEEGALNGPSIMPGGAPEAYQQVEPMLTKISAHVDGEPCCTYIGPGGAGHYVKMVHNGIEYADIQLIAEAYDLLSHALELGAEDLSRIFAEWNKGDLESYLIQITSEVLAKRDRVTGRPLVDVILDEAAQKGTGKWASQSALDLGIPVTAITEAVFARFLSALKADRQVASRTLADARRAQRHPACSRARIAGRRRAQRALCLEDGGLRAGIRADAGRLQRVRLGPEAGRDRPYLARRLHHSSPFPQSHHGCLRGVGWLEELAAGALLP